MFERSTPNFTYKINSNFSNLNPFDFKVLVGTNDLNNGGILKEYDFRIPHENFTRINNTFRDDIGLVKLKDPLQFSDDIKPISFPIEDPDLYSNSSDLFYSYNFTFAGWGLTIVSLLYEQNITLYTVEI